MQPTRNGEAGIEKDAQQSFWRVAASAHLRRQMCICRLTERGCTTAQQRYCAGDEILPTPADVSSALNSSLLTKLISYANLRDVASHVILSDDAKYLMRMYRCFYAYVSKCTLLSGWHYSFAEADACVCRVLMDVLITTFTLISFTRGF